MALPLCPSAGPPEFTDLSGSVVSSGSSQTDDGRDSFLGGDFEADDLVFESRMRMSDHRGERMGSLDVHGDKRCQWLDIDSLQVH